MDVVSLHVPVVLVLRHLPSLAPGSSEPSRLAGLHGGCTFQRAKDCGHYSICSLAGELGLPNQDAQHIHRGSNYISALNATGFWAVRFAFVCKGSLIVPSSAALKGLLLVLSSAAPGGGRFCA